MGAHLLEQEIKVQRLEEEASQEQQFRSEASTSLAHFQDARKTIDARIEAPFFFF